MGKSIEKAPSYNTVCIKTISLFINCFHFDVRARINTNWKTAVNYNTRLEQTNEFDEQY